MIFDRYWSIKIQTNPVFSFIPPAEFEIKPDENNRSLRVQFDISATKDFKNYSGTIKIFNLSADKRAQLAFNLLGDEVGTGPSVQMTAGYKSKSGFIFNGAINRGYSVRDGIDWITHLRVGLPFKKDFEITIPQQEINDGNLFSFLFSAVESIKNQPNRIAIPNAKDYKSNFEAAINEWLRTGNVKNKSIGYHGYADQIMSEISREFDLNFFQDSNGWNVIRARTNNRTPWTLGDLNNPEFVFSPENGLLGAPIYTDTGAKIITYLRPDLKLFQAIGVRSQALNRNISILELIHRGDTHGNDWFSEIDGASFKQND